MGVCASIRRRQRQFRRDSVWLTSQSRVSSAEPAYDKAAQWHQTINEWIERRSTPLDFA